MIASNEWYENHWWNSANQVSELSNSNADLFQSMVFSFPDAFVDPLWNYCDQNSDNEITLEKLMECGHVMILRGSMEQRKNVFNDLMSNVQSTIDADKSNSLNHDEFKMLIVMVAAVEARVTLAVRIHKTFFRI